MLVSGTRPRVPLLYHIAALALAYHGVLAHQDDALAAHAVADLVHLLRGDIVDGDDEDALVLLEQALELVEVGRLGGRLAPHSV